MILRQATLADLEQLLKLEQAIIDAERPFNRVLKSDGATYYNLPDLITSEQSCLLVMQDEQEIIACGYIQIRQSEVAFQHLQHGYLGFMFVDEKYRGQGVNQKIMQALIKWGEQKSVTSFYLDVYVDNQSAIQAYKKLGFHGDMIKMALHK